MTIASALTALNTDIQNARTAITNKGGTVTSGGGSSQLATDIGTITELKGSTTSITPTISSQTVTPTSPSNGFTSVTVPAVTAAIDSNIQAGNILQGKTILGVAGNVVELKGQTGTGQVGSTAGTTFYPSPGYNGFISFKATPKNYARTITPSTSSQTINVPSGYSGHGQITVNAVTSSIDANITAENIKKDVTILNVTGTLESGGGGGGGHVLEYLYEHSNGQHMNLTINNTLSFPLFQGGGTQSTYSRVLIPSVEKIKVDSDDRGYWSDCILEFTSGGVTRSLSFGEEVILYGDSKLKLLEADCLLKGTAVTMVDGSIKEISQIQPGDIVMSIDPQTGELFGDEVIYSDGTQKNYADEYDLWEFENGIEVRTAHHHRFYNIERQAFVYLDEFEIGQHTIDKDGNQVALLKHTNMKKLSHHFTIATKNWNIYFANGLVCGNRRSSEIHLGTEEQKQVQSTPSENIGEFLND